MFMSRSEYDQGVNTYSPEGRLHQVEYAIEAIKLGSTALAIKCSDGVVIAAEKRTTSPLMESWANEKISEIDGHMACAHSGLMADSRTLLDRARVEAQHHWFTYNEKMSVESCVQAVANLAIQFGDTDQRGAMSRPFGLAVLFAGVDVDGTSSLFFLDPSGTFVGCEAKAIGAGSEGAQQSLQENYNKSITVNDAIKSVMKILKQVMEEKLTHLNVEVATVTKDKGYHLLNKDELQPYLS